MISAIKRWVRWRLDGRPVSDPSWIWFEFNNGTFQVLSDAVTNTTNDFVILKGSMEKTTAEFAKLNELLFSNDWWGDGPYGDKP